MYIVKLHKTWRGSLPNFVSHITDYMLFLIVLHTNISFKYVHRFIVTMLSAHLNLNGINYIVQIL